MIRAFVLRTKYKKRIAWLLGLVAFTGILVGLVLTGLQSNLNLFLTPSDIQIQDVPLHQRFRLGGMVVTGSVAQGSGIKTRFALTDFQHQIWVDYEGVLPDLFREGQGIVAEGHLREDGVFDAQHVLAKHDEKYMPPAIPRTAGASGAPHVVPLGGNRAA